MSEPLSLHDLDQQARKLEAGLADGRIKGDAAALRTRIDAGYVKVAESGYAADDARLVKAQKAIAELEDQLARTEKQLLIPHYFEQALLLIARDALKWSSVPEGSRIRVLVPGSIDMTVKLDNAEISY